MKKIETFSSLLKDFEHQHDLRSVFNDFLTLTICAFSQNPQTGLSFDEDLYLQTIAPYKNCPLRHHFARMLSRLVYEMEERMVSDSGNDVLGEFYEQHLYRKGASQYFTPFHICAFMAKVGMNSLDGHVSREPLRVLDQCCGSGRMLLAAGKVRGPGHEYYGIDIDNTCVKMTALNLFLNGMFNSEVMCGDALVGVSEICYTLFRGKIDHLFAGIEMQPYALAA